MFADLWKLSNRVAVENYEGLTLENMQDYNAESLMFAIMLPRLNETTAAFLKYLVNMPESNATTPHARGTHVWVPDFLYSFGVVMFPREFVWADHPEPITPEQIALTHQLETASKVPAFRVCVC